MKHSFVTSLGIVAVITAFMGCPGEDLFGNAGNGSSGKGGGAVSSTGTTTAGGGEAGARDCMPPGDGGSGGGPCEMVMGCTLWLRADRGVTLQGSLVSSWADQSGAGHDATQNMPSSQPGFREKSGPGCRPGIDFVKPEGRWMNIVDMSGDGVDHTIIAVLDQRPPAGIQMLLSSYELFDFGPAVPVTPNTLHVGGLDSTEWRDAGAAQGGPQQLTWIWNSGSQELSCYRNGSQLMTAVYEGALTFGSLTTLGKYRGGTNQSNGHYLDAIVSEVVVYDRALDSNELGIIDGYVAERYDL